MRVAHCQRASRQPGLQQQSSSFRAPTPGVKVPSTQFRQLLPSKYLLTRLGASTAPRGASHTTTTTGATSSSSTPAPQEAPPAAPAPAVTSPAGSVFGATALITGSTVGAGMLALPAVSAGPGFFPSAGVLCACWALLTVEALLLAETNLTIRSDRAARGELAPGEVITVADMASETLGPVGAQVSSSIYLALSYTLLVAYIAKGGAVLDNVTGGAAGGDLLFTAGMAALLWVGGSKASELANRYLTGALVVVFLAICGEGARSADWGTLAAHSDLASAPSAFPIMFLSLVYHDLVPLLCSYMGGDRRKIRTALVAGSCVPLAMFLSWDAVTLAMIPPQVGAVGDQGFVDPLTLLTAGGGGGWVSGAIDAFSLLAIMTSFIGTGLGLNSFLQQETPRACAAVASRLGVGEERGETEEPASEQTSLGVLQSAWPLALALAPPLALQGVVGDTFFSALNAAGAYGNTLLYGVLPPLMVWGLRAQKAKATSSQRPHRPMVPGGKPILVGLSSISVMLEAGRVASDLGVNGGPGSPAVVAVEAAPTLVVATPQIIPQAGDALVMVAQNAAAAIPPEAFEILLAAPADVPMV